ncbi:MAG: helix-turn-helix domain-containing protein [Cytobacillus gottheilii]|uniref:helix-turn-helix domain-containing protein n=1 Tax=Cytobacillus gottheilii TaxID=859144 RepID=UPI003464862A
MVGTKIRKLRKERNMTLRQLADELQVPFTTLGNYERGDRPPDFQFVLNVAQYFGVPINYFSSEEESIDIYKAKAFSVDFNNLVSKAEPEVRKQILDIFDQLFLITCEHAISEVNNKELVLLQQIVSFISRMKNGFGLGIKKEGFSPSAKFELTKIYLKEKQDIDKYFNELLEIYLDRNVK